MSVWLAGAAVVSVAGGIYSANKSASAAKDAANTQSASADKGIAEERYRFDEIQKMLSPYVQAGQPALAAQQDLLGLNGQDKQGAAVGNIQNSPMFQQVSQQGEDAILQNAAATGGLRGGNTQGALAQFRPQLLQQMIDQQYQRLGGLTQVGQSSAAGVGAAGQQAGQQIAGLYQQQGAAQAGAQVAQGKAYGQMANSVAGAFGQFVGAKF
ncbi:MAG: hypothetical protein V4631_22090 [Pseudomonadota bacterium]